MIQSGNWRGARDVVIQSGNWKGARDVVIQSGNWRVACDTVWELGVHFIQPGNWRGARDAGNSLVKPIIQHEKNCGTGLVPVPNRTGTGPEPDRNRTGTGPEPDRNRTGTGPEPVPAQIPPEPEFRSGLNINQKRVNRYIFLNNSPILYFKGFIYLILLI